MQETVNQVVERAYALIRGNTRAELRFDEHILRVKYVVCGDGRLVMPAMVAMLQCVDTVLFVPACEEGALELQVTLEQFEERGEGGANADRWRIYHGEPEDVRWALVSIDAAKFEEHVIEGEAMMRSNMLSEAEPALCKAINSSRSEDLHALCQKFAGVNVDQPILVGVDPGGFDIRGRFDVHRVAARRSMLTEHEAMSEFDALAREASAL